VKHILEKTIHSNHQSSVYAVPVAEKYLIHSPLRRVTAFVNRSALATLQALLSKNGNSGNAPESLQSLCRELCQPVQEPPPERSGPLQPLFLGILPTRACNLACVYCDFGAAHAAPEPMDLRMATAAVDWMAELVQSLGQDTLEIHFFGGEPFVAGEVVDVVVHRARAVAARSGLLPRFEVATNGVFDENRARFVGDYFDTVVLSFDGPQEIHDRHRSFPLPGGGRGSFEIVKRTAYLLSQSPTELCFRVCVSQESVLQLEQIAEWFCETFRPATINFETLQPSPESEAAGLKPPNPYDFAMHYVRASRLIERSGIKAVYAAAATDSLRYSFCPVGKDTLIVSPDGRVSSCYLLQQAWQNRGLDLDGGRLSPDGIMEIDFDAIHRLRRMILDKPRCERCFCRWTCAGGCHVNHSYPGCSLAYDDFCIQTRIIAACALLDDLGFGQITDQLLADRDAMEVLALQSSDCLKECQISI
jgi:uncharacterized protein